jgi:diguanylate cyclase (GGDEF)-like protein
MTVCRVRHQYPQSSEVGTLLDLDAERVQEVLRHLEQAIHAHDQWLADLTRTIMCRLPEDQRDVQEDAHRNCRFGQWYYGNAPEALRDHPTFVAIGTAHQSMHENAARLLVTLMHGDLSPMEYDAFRNSVDHVRLEVFTLQRELDALTGAENRTGMLTVLRECRELVVRNVTPCSVAIMDLDHLKTINDTYGHRVGDEALATFVRTVRQHLRQYDKVYRYGGDEFLVTLTNADPQTAQEVVDRVRREISAIPLATDGPEEVFVSVSAGIAHLDPEASVEESIDRADAALYTAKTTGRNAAVVWDSSMAPIR